MIVSPSDFVDLYHEQAIYHFVIVGCYSYGLLILYLVGLNSGGENYASQTHARSQAYWYFA